MLEASARLLRLLALLQSRRFWSGADLAARLEVTDRTLRRDVDKLRSLGYPVDGSAGVAGGYQLGAGASLPPLLLEDDEALAVSIALRTAAGSAVTGVEEAAVRALVKLERVLPRRLQRRANALRAAIAPLDRSGPHVAPSTLTALASACIDHEQVSFRYAAPSRAAKDPHSKSDEVMHTSRVVEPAGLVHTGSRWYLVAWDTTRQDWRTFRLDRVDGDVSIGARFAPRPPPEGGDLRKYVVRSVSIEPFEQRARVTLFAPLQVVEARLPATVGRLERRDESSCVLYAGAPSLDNLALWIATLGLDFRVEEPEGLIASLGVLARRIQRATTASREPNRQGWGKRARR